MNSSTNTRRATISAFIICCNEEHHIGLALESVQWCDEIVVVDSGSKDRTLEIARSYGAKIFEREWPGFVAQKQFALDQCSSEWVLNIDADEVVSPELRAAIEVVLSGSEPAGQRHDGYHVNRVVFYLNRWWRRGGWYPEYRLRLCRRSATVWGGDDPHEKATVKGSTGKLAGELHHYTYSTISSQIRALNNFSETAARTMHKKGERYSFWKLVLRPPARFIKFYFLKSGFREGLAGFIVATFEAYYVFLKYAKLWELERFRQET